MDFYQVVDQVVELLRHRGRVSYRALQRQFGLDDAYLEDLKDDLRRFPAKNLPFQEVDAGLIKMSYLGNGGSRFNRASTASIAILLSEIPFSYTLRLSSTTG